MMALTFINFVVQAAILFFVSIGTIALLPQQFFKLASNLSGIQALIDSAASSTFVFIALGIGVWLLSQIQMLRLIVRHGGKFHVRSENYEANYIEAFYPYMASFFVLLIFAVLSIPAFILGGLFATFFNQGIGLKVFFASITAFEIVGFYTIYKMR